MRDDALKIIRAIGVDTGGSNIQFAVNPATGRRIVIEMNPRVSRSSALASKATGFPIAKIAARLATGTHLDALPNDITKKTPACFEPTIDYVVVKVPRFAFEKFPGAEPILGTQMKSVGETMAMGRTFEESLQKGLRGLETGRAGLGADGRDQYDPAADPDRSELLWHLVNPNPERIFWMRLAIHEGLYPDSPLMSPEELHNKTGVDPWFVDKLLKLTRMESALVKAAASGLMRKPASRFLRYDAKAVAASGLAPDSAERQLLMEAKQAGFSDRQLAFLFNEGSQPEEPWTEWDVRARRLELGVRAIYKSVDTCSGEFEAQTPYFYSSYEEGPAHLVNEARPTGRRKVVILGGGPNRIGQGIEFDYCCVQAVFALKDRGFETIMVNSNPETVSTDYDTADRLYFEPLTAEDVLNILENEAANGEIAGIIVQYGGQTPLKLARSLERYVRETSLPAPIVGTSPDSIDLAEDRRRFGALLEELGIPAPAFGSGHSFEEIRQLAETIGYPVMVRPSYVLGGRGMMTVYDEKDLRTFFKSELESGPEHPVLVDKFLDRAVEVDVDAVCDFDESGQGSTVIAAIMEHIEEAGIHSGDSACFIPTRSLSADVLAQIRKHTHALGKALRVRGLMNIQFAVKDGLAHVLEVNPRASRTVPFVSKTIGRAVAQDAARIMLGETLEQVGFTKEPVVPYFSVKEAVLPFHKFPGCEVRLGPEMRSTGEVMGIDPDAGLAFAKSQAGAGAGLPLDGGVFFSVNDRDKPLFLPAAQKLARMGYTLYCTEGTHRFLASEGIEAIRLNKVKEGRPNVVDAVINGKIRLVINTFAGPQGRPDEHAIRSLAIQRGVPLVTTVAAALAAVEGIEALRNRQPTLLTIQEYHQQAKMANL
jgi:carbamoyl-phosphate synthase large subunit